MKKSILLLAITSFFLISSASASFAGYRHYPSYRHHGHGGADLILPLGFGLIAGAIIAGSLAQPPPPRAVIYQQAPPVLLPPPVTYYSSAPIAPSYAPAPSSEELIINQVGITAQMLNVRSGPGLDTPIIDQIHHGEILDVIGAGPGWLYIRTASGLHGWVMAKYTSIRATPAG